MVMANERDGLCRAIIMVENWGEVCSNTLLKNIENILANGLLLSVVWQTVNNVYCPLYFCILLEKLIPNL